MSVKKFRRFAPPSVSYLAKSLLAFLHSTNRRIIQRDEYFDDDHRFTCSFGTVEENGHSVF
jgi:hypothetical protein